MERLGEPVGRRTDIRKENSPPSPSLGQCGYLCGNAFQVLVLGNSWIITTRNLTKEVLDLMTKVVYCSCNRLWIWLTSELFPEQDWLENRVQVLARAEIAAVQLPPSNIHIQSVVGIESRPTKIS